jgi:hypothetical protein
MEIARNAPKLDLIAVHKECKPDVAIFLDTARYIPHGNAYTGFYRVLSRHFQMFIQTYRDGDSADWLRAMERVWWGALFKLLREINECDDETIVKVIMITSNPNAALVLREIADIANEILVYTTHSVLRQEVSNNHQVMHYLPVKLLPRYDESEGR